MKVAVVSTGLANIASVTAALRRLGAAPSLTERPADVRDADAVVLPGVGALGPAMARLAAPDADGDTLADALRARVAAGRPTLAICLGLQLLCRSSDEAPGVAALGVADVHVARLVDAPSTPHFGWNEVVPDPGCVGVPRGFVYFAHSFAAQAAPLGFDVAWATHGGRFVAALRRGDVLACQFHPELSGEYGAALLAAWLQSAGGGPRC